MSKSPSGRMRLGARAALLSRRWQAIALTLETMVAPFPRSGQLVSVLEDWPPAFIAE